MNINIYSAVEHLSLDEAAALILAHEDVASLVYEDPYSDPRTAPTERPTDRPGDRPTLRSAA